MNYLVFQSGQSHMNHEAGWNEWVRWVEKLPALPKLTLECPEYRGFGPLVMAWSNLMSILFYDEKLMSTLRGTSIQVAFSRVSFVLSVLPFFLWLFLCLDSCFWKEEEIRRPGKRHILCRMQTVMVRRVRTGRQPRRHQRKHSHVWFRLTRETPTTSFSSPKEQTTSERCLPAMRFSTMFFSVSKNLHKSWSINLFFHNTKAKRKNTISPV